MCQVTYADGTIRRVKNLGWLLRHWRDVKAFMVELVGDFPTNDATLTAVLYDGTIYTAAFADRSVLWRWLCRPVFHALPVHWGDEFVRCGDATQPKGLNE